MSCKVYGHRGAKGLAKENSKAAFELAKKLNIDGIELDVRVTKDQVPVVIHDEDVKHFIVKDTSLRQLRTVDPDILTLSEALEITKGMALIIEIKPGVKTAPIFTVLKSLPENELKQHQLASFSAKILKKCVKELPDIERFAIEKWSGMRAHHKCKVGKTNQVIMRGSSLWSAYIRAVTKRGTVLFAYGVTNPKKANRWTRSGLSGVITDFPDRFVKVDT